MKLEQIVSTISQVAKLLWKINPRITALIFVLSLFWGLLTFPAFYLEKLILDKKQIKKAILALQSLMESNKNQNNLFTNEDEFVYLEINLNKVPDNYSIRPIQM